MTLKEGLAEAIGIIDDIESMGMISLKDKTRADVERIRQLLAASPAPVPTQEFCPIHGPSNHDADCSICRGAAPAAPPQAWTPTTADFDALVTDIWNTAGKFNWKQANAIRDLIHHFNVRRKAATLPASARDEKET